MASISVESEPLRPWTHLPPDAGARTRSRAAQHVEASNSTASLQPGLSQGNPAQTPDVSASQPARQSHIKVPPKQTAHATGTRTTGLGKGEAVPKRMPDSGHGVKRRQLEACRSEAAKRRKTRSAANRRPILQANTNQLEEEDDDSSHGHTTEVNGGARDYLDDLDGSTLQDDHVAENHIREKNDPERSVKEPTCNRDFDTESEGSTQAEEPDYFNVEELKATVQDLYRVCIAQNLVAGVALKGAVLQNAGDLNLPVGNMFLASALNDINNQFDAQGNLRSPLHPQFQTEQFSGTVKAVLLKEKEHLKTSQQGGNISAFLSRAAELIPQLSSMAGEALGGPGSEAQKYGIICVWHLLVWIMETSVSFDFYPISRAWTFERVTAMKNLDVFMLGVLEKSIALAPNELGIYLIPVRYLPYYTNWISDAYASLQRVAGFVEGYELEQGQFLNQTLGAMRWFLNNANEQIERGTRHAELQATVCRG